MSIKMVTKLSLLIFSLIIGATMPRLVAAQSANFSALKTQIQALAANPPGGATVGISVIDINTGTEIYALNGDLKLNPASNIKVATAASALKKLGPDFQYKTALYGKKNGTAIRGPIYIKGEGDPSLTTKDLWEMAIDLKNMGIRRIEGGVVVDNTFFDNENQPYAYDQQPDEDNKFRAPVGAVSLNKNAIKITIRPNASAMAKARVATSPRGYAVLTNDTLTIGQGSHNPKIMCAPFENRTKCRVWGQIPLSSRATSYYKRIDNPSQFTGYALKAIFEDLGISVGGGIREVRTSPLPPGIPLLAEHYSIPLAAILFDVGKWSNNYVAETVLKTMGATDGKPATWQAALDAATTILTQYGLPKGSYTYKNGSGLFDANRISARQFVKLMQGVFKDSSIRSEFISQLAIGGVDGTIKTRYKKPYAQGFVRAKTGTLADVSALTGYVLDKQGNHPIAFSILINKAPGYVSAARKYQEQIVTAIAKFLNN